MPFLNPDFQPLTHKGGALWQVNYCNDYPVASIEDPFDQEDWENTAAFTALMSGDGLSCQVVGDDLLVTNPKRVSRAIEELYMLPPNSVMPKNENEVNLPRC